MSWNKKKRVKFFHIRSCKYKIQYKTLKDGLIALLKRRDDEGWTIDTVYKCLFCDCYHLGNKSKKTKQRIKEAIKLIGEIK